MLRLSVEGRPELRRPFAEADVDELREIAVAYDQATGLRNEARLAELGRRLASWLDSSTWLEALEDPPNHSRVRAPYRATVAAILQAFRHADTRSRLLVTSRFRFRIADEDGRELSDALELVPVGGFSIREADKRIRRELPPLGSRDRPAAGRRSSAAGSGRDRRGAGGLAVAAVGGDRQPH